MQAHVNYACLFSWRSESIVAILTVHDQGARLLARREPEVTCSGTVRDGNKCAVLAPNWGYMRIRVGFHEAIQSLTTHMHVRGGLRSCMP